MLKKRNGFCEGMAVYLMKGSALSGISKIQHQVKRDKQASLYGLEKSKNKFINILCQISEKNDKVLDYL